MAIYIAVSPLQWRWDLTVDSAIKKSLSTYRAGGFKTTTLPVKLYLLNREIKDIKKKWVLNSKDTSYLGTYRATPETGVWQWDKVE
mgnify:FL=1|jgi:hypothetical protein